MKNILITSAGRRVSLVKAFQKEVKSLFPDSKVFTTDFNPHLSAACQVSDKSFSVCKVTDNKYIENLLEICIENKIGMVIPTIDTELQLLSDNNLIFKNAGINVIISNAKFVSICRDKRKTNIFFQNNNILTPKEINKKNLQFPLFIKPFNGSLSSEIHLINKKEELTDYLLEDEKFMFMEYLSPKDNDEYTVDMYYDKLHNLKCAIPRKRIEVRGGEISKGITCKNEILTCLKNNLIFIEGAVGCLTAQFFFNPKTKMIKGIEINPRFGGGFPLSYNSGGNYPLMLIKEYFLGEKLCYSESWLNNITMLRYDAEIILHE